MWIENIRTGLQPPLLQFPQLGELEKDVIRVHHRDDETCRAVANPAFEDVVAKEGQRRMQQALSHAGTSAVLVQLVCRSSRIAVDCLEVIVDALVREMLQFPA
jgi:hypothetical protein